MGLSCAMREEGLLGPTILQTYPQASVKTHLWRPLTIEKVGPSGSTSNRSLGSFLPSVWISEQRDAITRDDALSGAHARLVAKRIVLACRATYHAGRILQC